MRGVVQLPPGGRGAARGVRGVSESFPSSLPSGSLSLGSFQLDRAWAGACRGRRYTVLYTSALHQCFTPGSRGSRSVGSIGPAAVTSESAGADVTLQVIDYLATVKPGWLNCDSCLGSPQSPPPPPPPPNICKRLKMHILPCTTCTMYKSSRCRSGS